MATNPIYTGLTPEQQRLIGQQQYANITTGSTTNSLTNSLYNTISGPLGSSTTTGYAQQYYAPPIEKLVMCEPGWRYIRWRKRDEDEVACAEVLPILSLACTGQSISYILGEATPSTSPMTPYGIAHFLAVLTPNVEYDAVHWDAKAKAAWYDYRANEVAQRLLKSATGV